MFGAWVVLDEPARVGVACCSCGARRRIRVTELRNSPGACTHCGAGSTRVDRGGESKHPIYRGWAAMRNRCVPTAAPRTRRRYYDRGIRVCPEWEDYQTFRQWSLANGWAEGLQLDRRNNNLGYSPDNCRWTTRLTNMDNRGVSVRVTAWGETKLLSEWLDDPRCVVDYHCAWDRMFRSRKRWEPELALSTPKRPRSDSRAPGSGYQPQPRNGS